MEVGQGQNCGCSAKKEKTLLLMWFLFVTVVSNFLNVVTISKNLLTVPYHRLQFSLEFL
jgi:hypothetical protein